LKRRGFSRAALRPVYFPAVILSGALALDIPTRRFCGLGERAVEGTRCFDVSAKFSGDG